MSYTLPIMTTLKSRIQKSRTVKDNSLNTYMTNIKMIYHAQDSGNTGSPKDTEFLQDHKTILKYLRGLKDTTRKIRLTSIIVALKSDDPVDADILQYYVNELHAVSDNINAFLKKQQKTPVQEKNWLTMDSVNKVRDELREYVMSKKIPTREELNRAQYDGLQQYVLLSTYLEHTLRNDFADMPIITIAQYKKIPLATKEKTNYLVMGPKNKMKFHINAFKNVGALGAKVLDVSDHLRGLIELLLKFNKSGYLFTNLDRTKPMKPAGITNTLNRIFKKHTGKTVGSTMLRHIIISDLLKGEKTIAETDKEKKDVEDKFMHSKQMNALYRKL